MKGCTGRVKNTNNRVNMRDGDVATYDGSTNFSNGTPASVTQVVQ
jgi:hypothetical protein